MSTETAVLPIGEKTQAQLNNALTTLNQAHTIAAQAEQSIASISITLQEALGLESYWLAVPDSKGIWHMIDTRKVPPGGNMPVDVPEAVLPDAEIVTNEQLAAEAKRAAKQEKRKQQTAESAA